MTRDEVNIICVKALAELRKRGLDMDDHMTMIPNPHYNIPVVAIGPDGLLHETRVGCFDDNEESRSELSSNLSDAEMSERFPHPWDIVADYVQHMMHTGGFYEDLAARFVYANFLDAWNVVAPSRPLDSTTLKLAKDLDGKTFLYGRLSGSGTCWTRCREMRLLYRAVENLTIGGWAGRQKILDSSLVTAGPTINSNFLDVRELKALRI